MNIGYYAHSHGTGHCRQADKLAALLESIKSSVDIDIAGKTDNLLTLFTSMQPQAYHFEHIDAANVVRLPDEHPHSEDVLPGRAGQYWQPECLHYSPVGSHTIQRRSQLLLSEVAQRQIALMIIDLSVEVALLCRTASVPYLYVRLPGNRDDAPHRNAFAGAIGLLAAYPRILESADTPDWVCQKTLYLGFAPPPQRTVPLPNKATFRQFLAQFLDESLKESLEQTLEESQAQLLEQFVEQSLEQLTATHTPKQLVLTGSTPIVTVIKGFGGHQNIDENLPKLRALMPHAVIISLGPIEVAAKPYVDLALQVDDVTPFLQHSDLLVMACGLNAIGEACQFATPLLVLPDSRPHAEQEKMAQALVDCGRALTFADLEALCQHQHLSQNPSLNPSQNPSLNPSLIPSLSLKKPNQPLIDSLQTSINLPFVRSLAQATDIKSWFYEWLLPKLRLKLDSV